VGGEEKRRGRAPLGKKRGDMKKREREREKTEEREKIHGSIERPLVVRVCTWKTSMRAGNKQPRIIRRVLSGDGPD